MAVTQKQIAQQLGVSRQLVGFALTDTGTISADMKERIVAAAQGMGYRPNGMARAMKSGRFGCAALLLSTHPHVSNLPAPLLEGVNAELANHDFHLTLAHLPHERLSDGALVPKILREWMADGLLIDLTHQIPARFANLIAEHHMPAVWINSRQSGDCVYPDDFEAGRRAGEHLLELGHRRLAFAGYVAGEKQPPHHYSAFDRRDGVSQALQSAGILLENVLIEDWVTPLTDFEARVQLWREILRRPVRPTAIVAYSDAQTSPVLRAAELEGLQVPGDLSLVTFGADSRYLGRVLTHFELPNVEVGRAAVRQLLRKIEAPDQVLAPLAVSFAFEPGQTCAAPPENV